MTSSARAAVASSSRAVRSVTAQPSTALSGVRSSWDSVARNSSFIRLAASASSRACCSRARSRTLRSAMAAWSASSAQDRLVLVGEGPDGAVVDVEQSLDARADRDRHDHERDDALGLDDLQIAGVVGKAGSWLRSSLRTACRSPARVRRRPGPASTVSRSPSCNRSPARKRNTMSPVSGSRNAMAERSLRHSSRAPSATVWRIVSRSSEALIERASSPAARPVARPARAR